MNRHNFARPSKRQKPNAPIITKYPVPPHVQQNLALQQQYYGAPQHHHSAYPPHQGGQFPPTPVSAQSPSQVQWQNSAHQQHYTQQYQQGGHYQQGNSYQNSYQNSYPTPVAQTPSPFHNPHNGSHHQNPKHALPFNHNQATHQHVQPHGFQGQQSFTGASPSSTISLSNGYSAPQHHDVKEAPHAEVYQAARRPSQSLLIQRSQNRFRWNSPTVILRKMI